MPGFNLEQTGEGTPFNDEKSATEFAQLINGKNQTVPHVVLMSTAGFFGIALVTNIEPIRGKYELRQYKKIKTINGKQCGFVMRYFNCYVDKPRELVWEKILPATKWGAAEKLFRKKIAESDVKNIADKILSEKADAAGKAEPTLTASQLHLLSKDYPEIVKFLKNQKQGSPEEVYAAFQSDTLVLTGKLVGSPENMDFEKNAKAIINALRRKTQAGDDGYYELVAFWYPRRYGQMTPQERYDDLQSRGYKPQSPDAIRKFCERHILPHLPKPAGDSKSDASP
jgi:hypothetical protein